MVAFGSPQVAQQFQTPICSPAVKQGLILEWEAEKSTYLNELDVRKPSLVSISKRSEELSRYNLVQNLTIKSLLESSTFKCISWLNGSFFGGDDRNFLKEEVKT